MTLRHDDDASTQRATRDATSDAAIGRATESQFDGTPTKRVAPEIASTIATETEVARAFLSDDWMRRTAQATRHDASDQSLGQLAGYCLMRIVQRGVQGTVYEAVESRTGRRVAIKRLPLHDATSIESARFARETEALAVLRHPNIVSLLAAPVDDGARLLVMEWIDGVPLDRWADDTWSRLGARDATTAIVVCLEKVVSAVASAHARGIMHRDLKPSNVLILPTGEPKVLDFGLAKALTGATEVTRANGFAGTPAWAAPEQVTGDPRDIDARTDVHGLGLLLYRALAGRTAFDGTLPILPLFEAIKTATPAPPSRERKSVARELDCITLRALEKEPARRYQSAESLTRDLARFLSGEPIDAHPPSAWYIARKFVRRHRAMTALAAITAAAVVGGTALSAVLALDARDARHAAEQRADEADRARDRAERMNGFFQELLANLREREVAGDRAGAREILTLAAESLERAGTPSESEVDLRLTLGRAFHEIGDYGRSANEYARAAALLSEATDPVRLAQTLMSESQALVRTTERRRCTATARRALAIFEETHQPPALLAEGHATLARALHYEGPQPESLQHADLALELARAANAPVTVANALSTGALALEKLGRLEEATNQAVEAANLAKSLDAMRPLDRARLLHNAAYLLEQSGKAVESLALAEESLAIREAHFGKGHPATVAGLGRVAAALRRQNRLEEAMAIYNRSIEIVSDETPEASAIRGNTRRHLARTHDLLAAQLRGSDPTSSNKHRDIAIDLNAIAAEELMLGEAINSRTVHSAVTALARGIGARDGREALLAYARDFPRELAQIRSNDSSDARRVAEAHLRAAVIPILVDARRQPLFVADQEWIALVRADLAAVDAESEVDAALHILVELGLCELLGSSADPADRLESRTRAEALVSRARSVVGELSPITARCEALVRR